MIGPSLAILVIIVVTVIVAVITSLHVFYSPSVNTILAFAGILAGVGSVILIFEIYRQSKKLKGIDKGKKLLEIEQRGIDVLPRWMRMGVTFYLVVSLAFGIFLLVKGEGVGVALLASVTAVITAFFTRRKVEIYERGNFARFDFCGLEGY